jgi:hypothetical protein
LAIAFENRRVIKKLLSVSLRNSTTIFTILFSFLLAQAQNSPAASKGKDAAATTPNFSASGLAILTSHFIYHGLSMSDKNPALNAQLLLNMGSQFKLGFWGSNIHNVTNPDDNFWVQYQGVIVVDFSNAVKSQLTIADNRFYTSQQRNGQSFNANFEIKNKYFLQLDFNNNFEGTGQASQYINGGYLYKWKGPWFAAGYAGYTLQKTEGVNNYVDVRLEGIYNPLPKMKFKIGLTGTSDSGQMNGRGAFTYFLEGHFEF